jgi:hypothetical protein
VREEVDSLSFIWGDTYLIAIGNVPKLEKDLIGTNLRTDINSMGTNMTTKGGVLEFENSHLGAVVFVI